MSVDVRVFEPADLISMGQACDQVCDELGYRDARYAREAVASYIIALASQGHCNADWLRAAALMALGVRVVRDIEIVVAHDAATLGSTGCRPNDRVMPQ